MKNKHMHAFMDVAERFAELSTAKKLKVGSIIVKDNRIISIGYNGTPSGWGNDCEDIDPNVYQSWMNPKDYLIYKVYKTKPEVIHAESNAISKVARSADSCEGAAIFCTHFPCIECAKLIYQSGISKVYYRNDYEASKGSGKGFLIQCGIELIKVEKEKDV